MLNNDQVSAVTRRIADAFRANIRTVDHLRSGWGQFVDSTAGRQVGLYGTCSATIAIAAAYPGSLPERAVAYLEKLWLARDDLATEGPRYFSLTPRLAYFLLALRLSREPRLQLLIPAVEAEVLNRRAADNLFMDWYVSPAANSTTGKEFTTAVVILAYTLSETYQPIPDFIRSAARALQLRVTGAHDPNITSRRLHMAAIARALPISELSTIKKRIRAEYRRGDKAIAEYLYFWDYQFSGPAGLNYHRDYFYIPFEVVDVLLAANEVSGTMQRLAALDILQKFWATIEPSHSGLFYRQGATLAASKDQAWVVMALACATQLMKYDGRLARVRVAIISGNADSWAWNFFLPVALLVLFGICAAGVSDFFLGPIQYFGYLSPKPTWWDNIVKPPLSVVGIVLLTVMGETLWMRLKRFVASRLP